MRTLLCILLVLLTACAQICSAQEPYKTSDEAAAAIRQYIGKVESNNNCMKDAHKENDRNNANIDKQNQKIYDKRKEMNQALEEMRAGLFCSKCERSKSEIERELKISFAQHLADVKGVPVARPEILAAKEKQYRDEINNLVKEGEQYQQTFQGILKNWTQCRNEKVVAEGNELQAQYWTEVLSQREEAERRRKEFEEIQRKMQEKLEAERRKRALEMERAREQDAEKRKKLAEQALEAQKALQSVINSLLNSFGHGDDQVTTPQFGEDPSQINPGSLSNGSSDGLDGSDATSQPGLLDHFRSKVRDTWDNVSLDGVRANVKELFKDPTFDEGVNSGLSLIGKDMPDDWGGWAGDRAESTFKSRLLNMARGYLKPYISDNLYDKVLGEPVDNETKNFMDQIGFQENAWNEVDFIRGKKNVYQKIYKGYTILKKGLPAWISDQLNLFGQQADQVMESEY